MARKKADILLEKIKLEYLSGQLKVGQRLPAERALAEKYAVSRNSIRQALQYMQINGWIETKRGGGSLVKSLALPMNTQILKRELSQDEEQVFEMLEVRVALESQAAAHAAQRASADDLEKIKIALMTMARARDDVEKGLNADLAFHMHILEASRNQTLLRLVQTVRKQLEKTILATRQQRFKEGDRMTETINEHKSIYLAIAEGDAKQARQLMAQHILQVRKELAMRELDTV